MSRDPNGYYVYILFRENGHPFYVGKGRQRRWLYHERRSHKAETHKDRLILKILTVRPDVPKIKFAEGLTNQDAAHLETLLIQAIGREPIGPLINQTDGGDGCVAPSVEMRERISRKLKGQVLSAETRAKMSISRMGQQIPDESRRIGTAKRVGQKRSAETKAKMRAAKLGKPGNRRGAKMSEETKARLSAFNMGKSLSVETCSKMSAAQLARWARIREQGEHGK